MHNHQTKINDVFFFSQKIRLEISFKLFCAEVLRPSRPNGVMSSAVSLPNHTFTGQALSSKRLTSIVHILSPETDNCTSWISGRERMTVENISWSISTKECCRPRRGLNPRPPGLQSDGASNWATEASFKLSPIFWMKYKIVFFFLSFKLSPIFWMKYKIIFFFYIRQFNLNVVLLSVKILSETIWMKCQILLSVKNKKNAIEMLAIIYW